MMILKNGILMTMCSKTFKGDIAVKGGKIAAVDYGLPIEGAQVRDVSGCYIMPGIIDAHSHIGLQESGTRETDHNEKTNPISPQMRAIDAINPQDIAFMESREVGITTCATGPGSINLIGGTFAAVKTYGSTVEDMLLKQPVAMKAALGENPKFRYTEIGISPKSRLASAAIIRASLAAAMEYGRKTEQYDSDYLHMPDRNLGLEALLPVIRGDLPLKIHVHRADDIATAIRIAEEFNIRFTLDHCSEGFMITDRLLSALSKRCDGIIIGPLMIYKRKLECSKKQGVRLPKLLHDAGIEFAICTDFPEMIPVCMMPQIALSVTEGLPEDAALKAVTITAARILGLSDRVGSLEVGKDADIAVFSGHPLDYRSVCLMTLINGKIVYERK
ncbi:MAG: amidohydrolase [Clostridiaceae bacterium]|nr:amidohydrolase [Clostridiaceae bacterium]